MADPNKAVKKARLTESEKAKKLAGDLPHAGVVLVKETAKQNKKGKNSITSTFVGESDFAFNLDAGLLVDGITSALLVFYHDSIKEGSKPDGSGKHVPLTEKVKKDKSRRSQYRGYKTGFFAENIRRNKITGTTVKAQSRIVPPNNRNVFIAQEAKRGNYYFSIKGSASEVIEKATQEFIKGGIKNANRAPELGEKDSKD